MIKFKKRNNKGKMEYIQHSDIKCMCDRVRAIELNELKKSLNAHGGKFEWNDDSFDRGLFAPIVITDSKYTGPIEVMIEKIELDKDNNYVVNAIDAELCTAVNVKMDDIVTGYIHKIIDKIPATNEVKDVSIFKRVTLLERIKRFFMFKQNNK